MSGKTHAIIIGNERYQASALPDVAFAERDARVVHEVLTGAEVNPLEPELTTLLIDVTRRDFGRKLHRAFKRVQPDDSVIVYYAGHGLNEEKRGYLLPVDYGAEEDEAPNPDFEAVKYSDLNDLLKRSRPRNFLVILDACHSGSAGIDIDTRKAPGAARDLVAATAEAAFETEQTQDGTRLILASCCADQVARPAGEFEHGVFTWYLLQGLRGAAANLDGQVSVDDLWRYVRREVTDYARRHHFAQLPFSQGKTAGPLVLPCATRPNLEEVIPQVEPHIAEARAHLEQEDFAAASRAVETGLKQDPLCYALKQLQRQIETARRQSEAREEAARQAHLKQRVADLLAEAEAYEQEDELDAAVERLEEANRLAPGGQAADRLQALQARREHGQGDLLSQLRALFAKARECEEDDPAQAVEYYRQILEVYPDNPVAREGLERAETAAELQSAREEVQAELAAQQATIKRLKKDIAELEGSISDYQQFGMVHEAKEAEADLENKQAALDDASEVLEERGAWWEALSSAGSVAAARQGTKEVAGELPTLGESWTVPELGLELQPISAGRFMMGSEGHYDSEQPVHEVEISRGFWLGKYPVTQAEYEGLMGENPSHFKGSRRPVEKVSWDDAVSFCAMLTERERSAGRLPEGYEYRLATEAEWEYGCRAGSTGTYCFGNDKGQIGDYAWYQDNSGSETHEVGKKQPNSWGLYDVHGNVWEWCHDWFDSAYYAESPGVDPAGPAAGSSRVYRGGSWNYGAGYCRAAYRHYYHPADSNSYLGFRLALAPAVQR